MEFKGSRTEANLMAAFSGEAMAESRYNFYAQAARSEGLLPAAEIFEETARNEAAHAKLWFGALGKLGGTLDNLKDAQAGERFEWTDIYARFEREALDEGFERTAALFRMVGAIERMHDERYGELLTNCFALLRRERGAGYARFHLKWMLEWDKANRRYREACALLEDFPAEK